VSAVQLVPELELHAVGAELVEEAEQALESHDFEAAAALLIGLNPSTATQPRLALRALLAGSWARMQLGEPAAAATLLDRAQAITEGRVDHLAEIGNAQLVLARSLFERDRYGEALHALDAADTAFEQLGSASHRATGWVARAELEGRRGDESAAVALYRRAVDALQDIHF
jgi:tetratricopeptide (TPR) repeat protein